MTSQYQNERQNAIQKMIEFNDAACKVKAQAIRMQYGLNAEEKAALAETGAAKSMARYYETVRTRAAQWKAEVDRLTDLIDSERHEAQLIVHATRNKWYRNIVIVDAA